MQTQTFLSSGGDIHSEQNLPAHMIRWQTTTQAVANRMITTHVNKLELELKQILVETHLHMQFPK